MFGAGYLDARGINAARPADRPMSERAEILRRRIALYRRYLAEGVDAELARQYLRDIAHMEAELAEIEKNDPDPA